MSVFVQWGIPQDLIKSQGEILSKIMGVDSYYKKLKEEIRKEEYENLLKTYNNENIDRDKK